MPKSCKKCLVASCVTDSRVLKKVGVTLRYYSFPKDKKLQEEWLHKCNKSGNKLLKCHTICSRHFHIDDYADAVESRVLNVNPKKLKPGAIPSLFLERRPEKLLKGNSLEYHKILAQDILNEEKQAASRSSELSLPIYLEFPKDQKSAHKSLHPKVNEEWDNSQRLKTQCNIDSVEDLGNKTIIDIKEEAIIKPYVDVNEWDEDLAEDIGSAKSKSNINDFIGNCYVCDRKIKNHETLICDFTEIIQRVLEDISPDYEVVVKRDDRLCSTCHDLMTRIVRLEAELRTATLGIRALLRLKYSFPPPLVVNKASVENTKLRMEVGHKRFSNFSGSTKLKDRMTQTTKTCFVSQKHKLVQTTPNLELQKKQTILSPLHNKCEIKTVVTSINDVEVLEAGGSVDKETDGNNMGLFKTSSQILRNECRFDGISDITDLSVLLNDNCLAEQKVVTEVRHEADVRGIREENQSALEKKLPKTNLKFGLLKCRKCRFKTKSAEQMKTHILSFEKKEGFYCSICDYTYHVGNYFKRHKMSHSETSEDKRCIFCNERIHDKLHMKFHIEASHRKNSFAHKCSVCNTAFMFASEMRRHQKLKHKIRANFECEKCKRTFGDKIKYDSHIEYFHRDSLVCKYCLRECASIEKLIVHENAQHSFDRKESYQCSYCPKRFLRQDLLPLHEQQHTGQFEYRCDLCNYGFHDAELLKKHQTRCKAPISISKKILPINVNPPSQTNCVERFVVKKRLSKGRREPSHGSLVCDVCGKIINTRQNYKIHRELHDNPAAFQCHVCGKRFRYEDNMAVHIKNLHMAEPD